MSGNNYLAQLKSKPSLFKGEGFEVMLRPITFEERQKLMAWIKENENSSTKGMDLERKLVAMTLCDDSGNLLIRDEKEVGDLDPDKVDEIAMEAGRRAGLNKSNEKKMTQPSSSTIPPTASHSTSPLPEG